MRLTHCSSAIRERMLLVGTILLYASCFGIAIGGGGTEALLAVCFGCLFLAFLRYLMKHAEVVFNGEEVIWRLPFYRPVVLNAKKLRKVTIWVSPDGETDCLVLVGSNGKIHLDGFPHTTELAQEISKLLPEGVTISTRRRMGRSKRILYIVVLLPLLVFAALFAAHSTLSLRFHADRMSIYMYIICQGVILGISIMQRTKALSALLAVCMAVQIAGFLFMGLL